MRFAVVVNTFTPDLEVQMGRIMRVIRDTGLDTKDGTLVMCSRLTECIHILMNDPQTAFRETVDIAGELCMPQSVAEYLRDILRDIDLFITPGNMFGNELAVHIGSFLGGSTVTGVTAIDSGSDIYRGKLRVKRNIYANHVSGSFEMNRKPFCISLDNGLPADPVQMELREAQPEVVLRENDFCTDLSMEPREMSADLDKAACVVIGGNGLKNRRNAGEMASLAESAGMIAAGTRPCVMNAWLPMSRMIGVSGSIISPKVAILLGISGAPAFYEGVKNSRRIIAVNKDPESPISRKADLVITGDCMEVFRAFTEKYTEGCSAQPKADKDI